jgi:hypothetical protein
LLGEGYELFDFVLLGVSLVSGYLERGGEKGIEGEKRT